MIHTVLNPSAAPSREPSDGLPAGRASGRRTGAFASLLSSAMAPAGALSTQAASAASSARPLATDADDGPADRPAGGEAGTGAGAASAGIDGAGLLAVGAALLGGGLGSPSADTAAALPGAGGTALAGAVPAGAAPPAQPVGVPSAGHMLPPGAETPPTGGEGPPAGSAPTIVPLPSGPAGQGWGCSSAGGGAAHTGLGVVEGAVPGSAPAPGAGDPPPDGAMPGLGGEVNTGLPGAEEGIHRQPSQDPDSPLSGNPPFAGPTPVAPTPPPAGQLATVAIPGPAPVGGGPGLAPVDGGLVPEVGTGGVTGPGAAADPESEGLIDAAGSTPGSALAAELTAADRVPLPAMSNVSVPTPAGGRLAERVAVAVERLQLAPQPRSVVLDLGDLGGMRLSISLRGQAVHVTVLTPAGVGQPPSADWSRDLASALAGRGFELAGFGDGDAGERGGRQRPQERPDRPGPATATGSRPRRGRRETAGGWRL